MIARSTPVSASIIAVGSEILSGQITNRNAAWISSQLYELGIDTKLHLAVDDVESDIIEALRLASEKTPLILMTGGLGPTSDDLTRQAVAKFSDKPLQFDAASWTHIEAIFSTFSRTVPETNRQQCYFPASSEILENPVGTANAFRLDLAACEIWVLPGPPREVQALWEKYVQNRLSQCVAADTRKTLHMWRTIGLGESHLAEKIEPILQQHANSQHPIEVAYRAHPPFVETKIRFPSAHASIHAGLLQDLEQALAVFMFERGTENLPRTLIQLGAKHPTFSIYDGASRGHLMELLAPYLRESTSTISSLSVNSSWENHEHPEDFLHNYFNLQGDVDLSLAIAGYDASGNWAVGLKYRDEVKITSQSSPYRLDALRNGRAVAHLSTKVWYDLLMRLSAHM